MVPWRDYEKLTRLPEFRGCVADMFRRPQHELGLWLHHVREDWRKAQWTRVFRDRPTFKGTQRGSLRDHTLAYLRRLDHDSKSHSGETVTVTHMGFGRAGDPGRCLPTSLQNQTDLTAAADLG